jgi:hypothetical protein
MLINQCDENSRIVALNAADILSPPKRLITTYNAFEGDKIDWFKMQKTIMYNITTGDVVLYDTTQFPDRQDSACPARSLEVMRLLPKTTRRKGIDTWIHQKFLETVQQVFERPRIRFHHDGSENWKYGLNTFGLNNISLNRGHRMQMVGHKDSFFVECPVDIRKTIPPEILGKLRSVRRHIRKHKKGLPEV